MAVSFLLLICHSSFARWDEKGGKRRGRGIYSSFVARFPHILFLGREECPMSREHGTKDFFTKKTFIGKPKFQPKNCPISFEIFQYFCIMQCFLDVYCTLTFLTKSDCVFCPNYLTGSSQTSWADKFASVSWSRVKQSAFVIASNGPMQQKEREREIPRPRQITAPPNPTNREELQSVSLPQRYRLPQKGLVGGAQSAKERQTVSKGFPYNDVSERRRKLQSKWILKIPVCVFTFDICLAERFRYRTLALYVDVISKQAISNF